MNADTDAKWPVKTCLFKTSRQVDRIIQRTKVKTENLLVHLLVHFPQRHRCRAAAEEMRPGGRDVPDCCREVAKEQRTAQFETASSNLQ